MRGMLVDDHQTVTRLGDDIVFVDLRSCGAKRGGQKIGGRLSHSRAGVCSGLRRFPEEALNRCVSRCFFQATRLTEDVGGIIR